MNKTFERSGISFQYPSSWKFSIEETEGGWTASIDSLGAAFLFVSFSPEEDEPDIVADSALEALKASYPDLEARQVMATISELPAIGYDVEFFALDLTNTAWIRAVGAVEGVILVMGQFTDEEWESCGPVLQSIIQSIQINDI